MDAATVVSWTNSTTWIGVGFGTAGLGSLCYQVVLWALEAGFRKFDTAEADGWYDQKAVGTALKDYFLQKHDDDAECVVTDSSSTSGGECKKAAASCSEHGLKISTKIPPWSLTSIEHIRNNAEQSRQELVGFCDPTETDETEKFPLDVYYIHAPTCWHGWHPRCDNPPTPLLDLRSAWLAMEAVVGIDHSATRIGLSNVQPHELIDIIQFVQTRQQQQQQQQASTDQTLQPPPRMPDVLQAYADPIEPAHELRRICQQYNIEFVSYSTLGTQHQYRSSSSSSKNGNPVLGDPRVQSIALKHDRSVAEVVLSWALQNGMSVIPRSSNKQHIQQLARLLASGGFLDPDDLAQIDSLQYSRS
jgi:diketogulonate reductase-like aldo/keto reductase